MTAVEPLLSQQSLDRWQLLGSPPDAIAEPAELPEDGWRDAPVPGTVALAFGARPLDGHPDYDASDWWYRCRFTRPAPEQGHVHLCFDGLATLAQVWLNGQPLLQSDNMFLAHRLDITAQLQDDNELVIVCRSLAAAMKQRRPRPRWKTALVAKQRLRWFRTSLLGRITGWSPAVAAVGPWRPVRLEHSVSFDLHQLALVTGADAGAASLSLRAAVTLLDGHAPPDEALLQLGTRTLPLAMAVNGSQLTLVAAGHHADLALWYPHSHGEPVLHDGALLLRTGNRQLRYELGRVGFRAVHAGGHEGDIRLTINGRPVFCRGGCWTHHDVVSLGADEALREALERVRDSGANMLRVSGTSVYQQERFYALCDELGLLVWQDFMFASLDYPTTDPAFAASITQEAKQLLRRLARHPCVAAYCGGSEIQQQAAMFGAPKEHWQHAFFADAEEEPNAAADIAAGGGSTTTEGAAADESSDEKEPVTLGSLVARMHPGVPYWPSSPCGGGLPFHVGEGISHYFGVGAYRRPLADVRLARVRFASECLAFSNVPEPQTMAEMRAQVSGALWPHHPAWKQGVPRDATTGWDFEDIRDHYLSEYLGQDAVRLRSVDPARYLTLSRLITGWLMQRVYGYWRSRESRCGGGLLWFMRDLRLGAGWGIIDARDRPKAAYYFLRRTWQPRCLQLLDRGLDGLWASIVNETDTPLDATLELTVYAPGSTQTASASRGLRIDAFDTQLVSADELLGFFHDLTHSYRFGPAKHEAIHARLVGDDGEPLAEDVYRLRPFQEEHVHPVQGQAGGRGQVEVKGRIERRDDALWVCLSADKLVYDVRIEVRDHLPEDNYFVLTPGQERRIPLRCTANTVRPLRGFIEASNLRDALYLAIFA